MTTEELEQITIDELDELYHRISVTMRQSTGQEKYACKRELALINQLTSRLYYRLHIQQEE